MKKEKITLCLLVFACSLLFTSCDDYLDVKPYGRTIPKTAEEFSALLHTRLNDIDSGDDEYIVGNATSDAIWDAACGDNFETCLKTSTSSLGGWLSTYVGNIVGSTKYVSYYSKPFEYIRDCNIVLSEMEDTGEDADKLRATAYAMRAAAYYQLMRIFCEAPRKGEFSSQLGLPIVTTFDLEATPNRSSLQETIDFIESDLQKSIAYHMTDDIYRFTEDVANGYLARLYFWTEQWDKALPIAQSILEKHPLLEGEAYTTMIGEAYDMTGNELLKSYRSGTSSEPFSSAYSGLNSMPVSSRFLSCFSDEEKETDIRYSLSVNSKREATKMFFSGMRAAEFKLIEAECYYHLGQTANALKSINELRAHRISDYTPLTEGTLPAISSKEIITQDAEGNALTPLIALILSERRKELFLEGDRFFEQKRNGSPEYNVFYNSLCYKVEKYMYTFPIPIHDLEINSGLEQNPGYSEIVNE